MAGSTPRDSVLVITAARDALAEGHSGSFGNQPEERKRLISAALALARSPDLDHRSVDRAEEFLALAEIVHSRDLLAFYERAWAEWSLLFRANRNNEAIKQIFAEYGDKKKDEETDPEFVPALVCRFGFASRHDGV